MAEIKITTNGNEDENIHVEMEGGTADLMAMILASTEALIKNQEDVEIREAVKENMLSFIIEM